MDVVTDEQLVGRALHGNREAFADVYDRYGDGIHDFCHSILRNTHDAADATQETFVIAWQRLRQLREPSRLRGWLYAIARHECLRRVRGRKRQTPVAEVDALPDASERGPDGRASEAELRELVWSAAAGLEERDQVVLDLSVRQELGGSEIADALGVRTDHAHVLVSNVRKRIERALGALLVLRVGRRDCPALEALTSEWDGRFSPEIRKRVTRHVDKCEQCGDRRSRLVSPTALLSTVPLVPAPFAIRDQLLGRPELVEPPRRPGRRRFPPSDRSALFRAGMWTAAAVSVAVVAIAGVVLTTGGGDTSEESVATTTREVADSAPPTVPVEPVATFCSVSAELAALGSQGPASPASADVERYFRTEAESFAALAPLAPGEISADVETLRAATGALLAQLEAADFSVAAVAGVDDAALRAARDRVEAFIATRCGDQPDA